MQYSSEEETDQTKCLSLLTKRSNRLSFDCEDFNKSLETQPKKNLKEEKLKFPSINQLQGRKDSNCKTILDIIEERNFKVASNDDNYGDYKSLSSLNNSLDPKRSLFKNTSNGKHSDEMTTEATSYTEKDDGSNYLGNYSNDNYKVELSRNSSQIMAKGLNNND